MDANQIKTVIKQLLIEAYRTGALPACTLDGIEPLSGDDEACFEGRVTAHTDDGGSVVVVARVGGTDCLDDALALRRAADDRRLPGPVRRAVRRVFVVREERRSSGCLLESLDGWLTLRDYYRVPQLRAGLPDAVHAVCALLVEAHLWTLTRRVRPQLEVEYLGAARIALGQARDEPLLAPRAIRLTHGEGQQVLLPPWPEVLDQVAGGAADLEPEFAAITLAPSLDAVLIRSTGRSFDVRFTAATEWETGDWLGDLSGLGGQLLALAPGLVTAKDLADTVALEHAIAVPEDIRRALSGVRAMAAHFAARHGDARWERRYTLGLGTSMLRLAPDLCSDPNAGTQGIVVFVEGLRQTWAAMNDA